MSDSRLRQLEKKALIGDPEAKKRLSMARYQAGLCPWCGGPAWTHILVAEGKERTCCCNLVCSVVGGNGGPDWTHCDGTTSLHCTGCPAVGCEVTPEEALAWAKSKAAQMEIDEGTRARLTNPMHLDDEEQAEIDEAIDLGWI